MEAWLLARSIFILMFLAALLVLSTMQASSSGFKDALSGVSHKSIWDVLK